MDKTTRVDIHSSRLMQKKQREESATSLKKSSTDVKGGMKVRQGTTIETRAKSIGTYGNAHKTNKITQNKYESYKVSKPGFMNTSSS